MLSDYLKDKFGNKLYKLILSSGYTCPNRDGKCGTCGCIFCNEKGSGEFAEDKNLSIDEQIESAKKKVPAEFNKYIAYFQSFTNTYASIDKLKLLYTPIVNREDIAILAIATRPDCLDDDVIEFLKELNKIKPVWIELGLQTSNDTTAKIIRRGYETSIYVDAVKKLREASITVITHQILGLPYETKEDMVTTSGFIGKYSDGIKFHNLYITDGTDIAELYKQGKIELLSKDEYIDILCECVRSIPKDTVIHRLTGDPDKNTLIAPLWCKDKITLLRDIKNAFYDRDVIQGEKIKNN